MSIIHPASLHDTLDAINEATFFGKPVSASQRRAAAEWIASRQGLPGSYCGMFAPTARDFRDGVRLFTGESVQSRAGVSHILGEEACRTLMLLQVETPDVQQAWRNGTKRMKNRLAKWKGKPGWYCCAKCSCALWRNLAVGGM